MNHFIKCGLDTGNWPNHTKVIHDQPGDNHKTWSKQDKYNTVDKELDKSQLQNVFVVISKYNVLYKVSSRYVKRLLRYNLYEKTGTFVLFSW